MSTREYILIIMLIFCIVYLYIITICASEEHEEKPPEIKNLDNVKILKKYRFTPHMYLYKVISYDVIMILLDPKHLISKDIEEHEIIPYIYCKSLKIIGISPSSPLYEITKVGYN